MQSDTQSFVVRIWHEAVDDQGRTSAWRGSIDHVGSANRVYFENLEKVVLFIQENAGIDGSLVLPDREKIA